MSDENLELTTNMIFGFIAQYCELIILCLCLLGNSLSVYVLFCTKLRYNSSSIYLVALAMSDIGVVLIVFLKWFVYYKIIEYNEWLDFILSGLQWSFYFLSVWLVVAFTIQRYVAIKWPLFRHSLCTVSRARIVVIGLTGLAVLYSILWFIIYANKYNDDDRDIENLIYIIILINFFIIFGLPATMIVVLVFNALIVHTICKQNRIQRNLILSFVASNDKTRSSDNEASHIKVTKMLVIISSIFVCLNLFLQGCVISMVVFHTAIIYIYISEYISVYLYTLNYGINVILCSATGKNFRRELIRLFTKRSNAERDDNMELNDIRNVIICD